MAKKITGISRDLLIHPGETLGDILIERGITQADLAMLQVEKKIYPLKFAFALEYALGVSKSFWINLQANYDAELLEINELETITEEERNARNCLKDIVKYLQF